MTTALKVEKLLERIEENSITIVDIREEYEFDEGSIEGSVNIPMDTVANDPDSLNKPAVFVCQTGKRAESLCYVLENIHNVKDVSFLEGGFEAYEQLKEK
jgi:rhodanese-related sulfurtransferase